MSSLDKKIEEFSSNEIQGLTLEQVEKNRQRYGINELEGSKKQNIFIKFLLQFKDALILILLCAAIISIIIDPKEWVDSLIIFIVILCNAILGVFQENKAEKSLEALKKMSSPTTKVVRENTLQQIPIQEVVVGDVVHLEAGDYVPADIYLIDCFNLKVDESALTGESLPVEKQVLKEDLDQNLPLGEQKHKLFSSTFITNGRAVGIVYSVGMKTEIGKIASMLKEAPKTSTPLQNKLNHVGKVIALLCLAICAVVFVLEMISGKDAFSSFKTAIALAVAAIPEGLATVVTILLAVGVTNLSKKNAVVKKLPAVETLGCTSVVCSDKTGTLTQNKMTVVKVFSDGLYDANHLPKTAHDLILYFALCSDAKINEETHQRIGDPTELALIDLCKQNHISIEGIKRVFELPFDSERKCMTVVVQIENQYVSITKGAPDVIYQKSLFTKTIEEAKIANQNMANEALRILGLGIKVFSTLPKDLDEHLEENLEFIGLVGMIDPAREEVKESIRLAKQAGIKVVMITGDHILTAKVIGRNLGILKEDREAISSEELNKLSDEDLYQNIEKYRVYARVAPADKVRIVSAWQKHHNVVAMTGDGVNDSPALKIADIGCAMGITGTDVSKEASDMILMDDNFSTIISAVKEGRGIYENIKKCVKYLLSSNIGEVLTIFIVSLLSVILGKDLGVALLPIHLLWINLITDSFPAIGLGMEKASDEVMKEKPRPMNESFFAHRLGLIIALEGLMIGGLTLISFLIGQLYFKDTSISQTMAFLTLSSCQLFHCLNVKSEETIFSKNTFNNKFLILSVVFGFLLSFIVIYIPGLNTIFHCVALKVSSLLISLGLAFATVVILEIVKGIKRKINKSK